MKNINISRVVLVFVLAIFTVSNAVSACTLFAASGDEWVKGGGTLINKNRDWEVEEQYTQVVFPSAGKYAYMGIYSAPSHGIRGGINEKGLVVITATASSIPTKERRAMPYKTGGIIIPMLTECSSVEQALSRTELFLGPQYVMIADKNEVAYIEIAPGGVYSIKRVKNNVLYHTNHYLDPSTSFANYRQPGVSSLTRYNRIGYLLNNTKKPFTLDDFIRFSNDQHDGVDNSIWRTGSKKTSSQTLAVFSVYIPKEGSPVIYTKIRENVADQGKEKISIVKADKIFKRY